jgi:hypothetical protein
MKSEIRVVNLILSSDNARVVVINYFTRYSSYSKLEVLLHLGEQSALGKIAEKLECAVEEVFVELARTLEGYIDGHYPKSFQSADLYRLSSATSCRHLANIFKCPAKEAMDYLLNPDALLQILWRVNPADVDQLLQRDTSTSIRLSVNSILPKIITNLQTIKRAYQVNEADFGNLLTQHGCINALAEARLREYAVKCGFETIGVDVMRLVKEAMDGSFGRIPRGDVELDSLAQLHLKQRTQWITRQLREEVDKLINQAGQALPDDVSIRSVQTHIEYYELKSPAKAWKRLGDSVQITSSQQDNLRSAIALIWDEIIQAFVLAGIDLPNQLPDFYNSEKRTYRLPITATIGNQDLSLPLSREEIVNRLIEVNEGTIVQEG